MAQEILGQIARYLALVPRGQKPSPCRLKLLAFPSSDSPHIIEKTSLRVEAPEARRLTAGKDYLMSLNHFLAKGFNRVYSDGCPSTSEAQPYVILQGRYERPLGPSFSYEQRWQRTSGAFCISQRTFLPSQHEARQLRPNQAIPS